MTKEQIAQEIREAEEKLASLRVRMAEEENPWRVYCVRRSASGEMLWVSEPGKRLEIKPIGYTRAPAVVVDGSSTWLSDAAALGGWLTQPNENSYYQFEWHTTPPKVGNTGY